MKEVWKGIENYEGYYQVSTEGRIKSLRRKDSLKRYWIKECILKLKLDHKGYLYVNLCKNGKVKTFLVHRLVAEAYILNPENKPEVNHKDGIKIDNEAENLEWATSKENTNHADIVLGKNCRGENHSRVKLTETDVLQIKNSKLKQRELAVIYKVVRSTIAMIRTNRNWRHLKEL